jgi:hypothetical protein
MSNGPLFITSCVLCIAHVLALCLLVRASTPWLLELVYVVGPLTSMWNHGLTSVALQWTDRCAMAAGACIDLYYIGQLSRSGDRVCAALLLASAVLAYAGAKAARAAAREDERTTTTTNDTLVHALAHALVLAAHVRLLMAMAPSD